MVMVVMPSLPKSYQCQQQAVAAVIRGFEPTITPQVAQGIDGEGSVVKKDGREEKSPSQTTQPINEVANGRGDQAWNPMELVQP